MDRGAWWATIYRVSKSRTRLNRLRTQHYCVLQSQLCITITTQANNPREKTAVQRQTGSEVALPKTPTCQSQGKAAESGKTCKELWREMTCLSSNLHGPRSRGSSPPHPIPTTQRLGIQRFLEPQKDGRLFFHLLSIVRLEVRKQAEFE